MAYCSNMLEPSPSDTLIKNFVDILEYNKLRMDRFSNKSPQLLIPKPFNIASVTPPMPPTYTKVCIYILSRQKVVYLYFSNG